ncbi:MAG: ABC transporter ATP-binding protein [Nitriliruptorales bacterium]|nr:ABC transporter ATP-binding protein [Nitriliruptorales bacterium]
MTDSAPAIELQGITKRFPGVIANEDVTLDIRRGEVHAIVGENGAGKSTLMKILYGMQPPDEGTIRLDGAEVEFRSPKDAIAAGIGMVHQHFMLAEQLTVLENVILGSEPTTGPRIDLRQARRRIQELGDRYGMDVDPDVLLEELEVGQRQRVEIIKVLFRGAEILILDEPTAVLVPQEVEELFKNIRELTEQGETVVFISHKLDEVLEIADRITVMRQGRTVATVAPDEVTSRELAELMVGSELPTPDTRQTQAGEHVVLSLEGATVREGPRTTLDAVDLTLREGEIVGVAGVEGNGQAVLIDVILGLKELAEGRVRYGDQDITDWATRRRREAGIAYIPEDRHHEGLLLPQPLWENTFLGHQTDPELTRGQWLRPDAARRRTETIIQRYDVRTPGVDVAAHALSGGNQQKYIIGREMVAEPALLIAAHPTRGIDVGAQAAVWDLIRQARDDGLAVLLVSADLDELIGLSDRLSVILRGRLVAELDPSVVTPEELGAHMTGAAVEDSP